MTIQHGQRDRIGPGRFLLLALVGVIAWAGPAAAEDAPEEPRPGLPVEALFAPFTEAVRTSTLPDFFKDTKLTIKFRSYYLNREKPDGTASEAWAFGGWLAYQSGLLLKTFGIGATFYGSAPVYAPDDKDGTTLLKPGQEGYYVLGEAYATLQYGKVKVEKDNNYILLKGYRQLVDLATEEKSTEPYHPYINPQDNRMTPNTFEGITAAGKVGVLRYLAGYLWDIKPRNADEFVSMAEQAGAAGSDDGVIFGTARLVPMVGLRIDLSEQYGINTFNTLYAEGEYLLPLGQGKDPDWKLRLGAQFTDQRAVGDELVANAAKKDWSTQVGGARIQAMFRDKLTLTAAFSITGSGNKIQTPWGSYPGYLSLLDQDFNRASEKAVLAGGKLDFSKSLSVFFNFAWGWDAIDAKTRASAPDQREYDLTVDYAYLGEALTFLKNLRLRLRGAILDQENASQLGWQVRIILNWERNILGGS